MTEMATIDTLIERMLGELQQLREDAPDEPLMVGIHTGGAWVAERLHAALGLTTPLGTLDISFYRDDFSRKGMHPEVRPSRLPLSIEDRTVMLVDDVLFSGRTVRAALNELFDYGRPAAVKLAVLVHRNGHELPIAADIAGTSVHLNADERVELNGPEPLGLNIIRRAS